MTSCGAAPLLVNTNRTVSPACTVKSDGEYANSDISTSIVRST